MVVGKQALQKKQKNVPTNKHVVLKQEKYLQKELSRVLFCMDVKAGFFVKKKKKINIIQVLKCGFGGG